MQTGGKQQKKSSAQRGHNPQKAIFKKRTFQKERIPKRARSILSSYQKGHIPFEHIPKKAHFKKGTMHIPNEILSMKNSKTDANRGETAKKEHPVRDGAACQCHW